LKGLEINILISLSDFFKPPEEPRSDFTVVFDCVGAGAVLLGGGRERFANKKISEKKKKKQVRSTRLV